MSETINAFEAALASEGFDADCVKPPIEHPKLEGNDKTKNEGTFVLTGQKLATEDGFRNVSKIWYDKTISFAEGVAKLDEGRSQTEDIAATVGDMVATVKDGRFAFHHLPSDRYFNPTDYAMRQVGKWADTGTWYVENMLSNPTDLKGRDKYARDEEDAATLAHVIRNGLRRVDPKKSFFWRTRQDGTLRAMLTDRFAVIDNRWLMEQFQKLVPGGRLSHWRGDADTIFGNILIPDSIRAETDSDYGGMLSIGNSEIGERRVSSAPSIFRAICMNGCIWGQVKGKGINQVHRGKIDLKHLSIEIQRNLEEQIPLLPTCIDKVLGLRSINWDGVDAKPVIAALAKDAKMGKRQAAIVLDSYATEVRLTPDYQKTAFALVNAVTRAGQRLTNAEWVAFDELGGEMAAWDRDDFAKVVSRGKGLSVKEVDEVFA